MLYGISGGFAIGVIRGLSAGECLPIPYRLVGNLLFAGPLVAGNWAVGTFALISLGSWCAKFLLR